MRRPLTVLAAARAFLSRPLERASTRRAARRYVAAPGLRVLALGSGPDVRSGWFNTDLAARPGVWHADFTRRLPFPDGVFDVVVSEHAIEHIAPAQARVMLREARRVLRPGGKLRLSTPDVGCLARLLTDDEAARAYVDALLDALPSDYPRAPVGVYNYAFYGWGHRFIYDEPTLVELVLEAGFTSASRVPPGEWEQRRGKLADFEALVIDAVTARP